LRPVSNAFSQLHLRPLPSLFLQALLRRPTRTLPRHLHRVTQLPDLEGRAGQGYFFKVRINATSPLISSGFRDPYLGILFLPLAITSVRSASDIFWTSAVVKS